MGGIAWTEEEDQLLKNCILQYGEGKWHRVPSLAGLNRCRKSCRLRWLNYLSPNIRRGNFSDEEVEMIVKLHKLLGNRWSVIAGRLGGRTANDVKNYWNCHLSKKRNAVEALEEREMVRNNIASSSSVRKRRSNDNGESPSQTSLTAQQESGISITFDADSGQRLMLETETEENHSIYSCLDQQGIGAGGVLPIMDIQLEQIEETRNIGESSSSRWDWDDLLLDLDMELYNFLDSSIPYNSSM